MRGALVLLLLAACGTSSSALPGDAGSDAALECCPIGDAVAPNSCVALGTAGRAKTAPDDRCLDPTDGMLPSRASPGWTRGVGEDGCPVWLPPPDAAVVCCNCLAPKDGGADG